MINALVNWAMGAIQGARLRRYRSQSTARTALILVHMQWPFLEARDDLAIRLGRLIAFARENEMPIYWSTFGGPAGPQSFPPALDMMRSSLETAGVAELPATLRPAKGDVSLPETAKLSAFYDTGLADMLASAGIERLVIAGPYAEIGVDSTARDATERDFYTTVISDCCGAQSDAAHDAALTVTLPRMVQQVIPLTDWARMVGGKSAPTKQGHNRHETHL